MEDAFRRLGQYFDQDVFVIHEGVEPAAAAFLRHLDPAERARLAAFLERSLERLSDVDLAALWARTGSDILVPKKSARLVFTVILDQARSMEAGGGSG